MKDERKAEVGFPEFADVLDNSKRRRGRYRSSRRHPLSNSRSLERKVARACGRTNDFPSSPVGASRRTNRRSETLLTSEVLGGRDHPKRIRQRAPPRTSTRAEPTGPPSCPTMHSMENCHHVGALATVGSAFSEIRCSGSRVRPVADGRHSFGQRAKMKLWVKLSAENAVLTTAQESSSTFTFLRHSWGPLRFSFGMAAEQMSESSSNRWLVVSRPLE